MRKEKKLSLRLQAFMISIIMLLTFIMPIKSVFALPDEKDQTENADIVRTLSLSYRLNGQSEFTNLESPYEIPDITKIQSFHANYSFEINDNLIDGVPNRTVKSGDYYLIDLPDKLNISNPVDGSISDKLGELIANYSFIKNLDNHWQVKVIFAPIVDDKSKYEIKGNINFDFTVDLTAAGEGTTTTISIPIDNDNNIDIDITKPVPPPTKPVSLTKTVTSYNDQSRELAWNIKMMPEIGVFSGCVFTDTIDISKLDLKSIMHGGVTLEKGKDYTYDSSTGKITYTIPNGRDGLNYQNIIITTVVKGSIYSSPLPTTIENTANLSGGASYVDIDSNTAAKTITPNWLGKSGTLYQGNKIKWAINANITNQAMYNAVITDNFENDVILDKSNVYLGSNLIKVYDNSHTPVTNTEVYGIYTTNGDGTSKLQIFLPRGQANASNNVQTVTLVTNVTAPSSKGAKDPVYNNTATLSGNYKTEGDGEGTIPAVNIGQIGVAVPYISIVKGHSAITADDQRNGTITWTIAAASNLSDYGQSKIVDTLPSDQDFIPGEIYLGTTKIDGTTEPKAEISADGRALTISFNSNKALATQQNFTVKTKIKQEIYGTNINGTDINSDFNNAVTGSLYEKINNNLIAAVTVSDKVRIKNTVISKTSSAYNGNNTKQGENPRVNFSIAINSNLMPLNNLVITDDLNKIITEFKKSGDPSFTAVNGVKWTYVPGSLNIIKNAGIRDSLNLAAIASSTTYTNNVITVNFGNGTAVNDKYTISFTAELDVSQNDIFENNGTIRCKGNIADISANGLKAGTISTPATLYSNEIKNEVLGKSGVHNVSEQQVLWSINLNQHKAALDSTKIVDILPKGLTLDPTTIKLYKNVIGTNGNFVTGSTVELQGTSVPFDYTYLPAAGEGMEGRYTVTVTLPNNNTDYILRFATDIDSSLLGKSISNSAYYVGQTGGAENSNTSSMTLTSSSGGSSTTKSSVTVNKLSKDNGDKLTGATFALYWLKNGNEPVFVRNQTVTNGSTIFRGLTKGEKYTVTEVSQPNGYLLDNKEPVTITAPLIGTGDVPPLTFYDTPIKTGSWIPTAIKKLDGKSIIHPFNFEILDGDSQVMTGATKDKLSEGSYSVQFAMKEGILPENITNFTDSHIFDINDPAGTEYLAYTKTFYMKEIASPDSPGYGFDNKVQTLVVKVYNVKGQADLKVAIQDDKGNVLSDNRGIFNGDKIPVFQNTYRAVGSILLSAEKKLTGHFLAADQFSFELYEGSTLIQTAGNKAGTLTGVKTYTGSIDFSPLNYNQSHVGTKTYTIKEKDTSLPGYTYDKAVYTVTVKITDNDDGTLTTAVDSIKKTVNNLTTDENKVSFTNTYTTSDIDVNLTGKKALIGRVLEDKQFSFKLNQVSSEGTFNKEIGTAANDENGNINLPMLTFKQEDIGSSYYYQVSEVNQGNPGYTYDNTIYTVKIDVKDNDDGTLGTTETIYKDKNMVTGIEFSNHYTASGKTQISATKTLNGKALKDQQFSFIMQPFDIVTGSNLGLEAVVKNNSNGDIAFPEINYSEEDAEKTFYYKVTEQNDGIGGYTYDGASYIVSVSVTDNGDGNLKAVQSIYEPTSKTAITFGNDYITSNTSISIKARKILEGRTLENQQFGFALTETTETGAFIKEVQNVKNDENGLISFDDINYTQADMGKTYYYQISEIDDKKTGYTCDTSLYKIKVQVVDNNNGTLSTVKTVEKDGQVVAEPVFTNKYTTGDVTIQFTGTKKLIGGTLTAGLFKYSLEIKKDEGSSSELVERTTNDLNGKISFSLITYSQADMGKTYYYTISEIDDKNLAYEYDKAVYTVKVHVIDNGDGTLKTVAALSKKLGDQVENVEDIEFTNKFVKITKTGTITDDKTGDPIGEATVIIKDKDGNVIGETKTDKEGKFEIPYLPIGDKVTVIVKKDGYEDKTFEIEITDDELPLAAAIVPVPAIPKTGSEYYNILMLGAVMFLITSYLIYDDSKKRKRKALRKYRR